MLKLPELYTRKGTYRAYHLAAIVFISSFMAGYDSGVAGGVLTYETFMSDFHYTKAETSRVNSLTVGLNQLGSFIAAIVIYPLTNKYGRKYSIMGSALVLLLGIIIQTINTRSLGAWYVGRIVAGLGQGGLSVTVPMYSSEQTPKEIRGRCGSFYQWMYTWGILIAYWVDYGTANNKSIAKTSAEWQIPVGLQLVAAGLLFIGTFTLPESTRWLLSNDRGDEAWKSLTWTRGHDGEQTTVEFNEIQLGLKAERSAKDNFSLSEIFKRENRLRFIVGPSLFVFQNTTGSSALAVFGPQFFKLLVGDSGNRDLLLTGLFGAVKVIACTIFILFIAERFGRRTLLTGGSGIMAVLMFITAMVARFDQTSNGDGVTAGGRATVALIYLDIMVYNCSWGPVPWAYVPEIFPTRIRSLGLAISMLAHWATSFCFSFASPYMIQNIGPLTFLIFMGFDILATIFCYFLIRETKGKNLELAAGTEWIVSEQSINSDGESGPAEHSADIKAEKQDGATTTREGTAEALSEPVGDAVIDQQHGKKYKVTNARDNFSLNFRKRG